jgi:protein-tyrosine phosphatase
MKRIVFPLLGLASVAAGVYIAQRQRAQRQTHPTPASLILPFTDPYPARTVTLEGAVNVRDVGGYSTQDGRRVRTGIVFRAGSLANLSERDLQTLEALNLRLICDLRSHEEAQDDPDRLPSSATYSHTPIIAEQSTLQRLQALLFDRSHLSKLVFDSYTQVMIDQNANVIGTILRRIADPAQRPLLIHCTAGKDRTGITSALLLRVLGVEMATVLADYSQSNHHYAHFRTIAQKAIKPFRVVGLKADDLFPLLVADPQVLQATFDYIDQKYGGVEAYLLSAAGLDADTLAAIRAVMLA